MRSLSGLKTRIADLLRARAEQAARPHTVAYMPNNHRGPAGDPDGTFTTRPSACCWVVHFDPTNPPLELVAARERDRIEAQVVPETETHSKGKRS